MHCLSESKVRDFAVSLQVETLIEEVSSIQFNFQVRHHGFYLQVPTENAA